MKRSISHADHLFHFLAVILGVYLAFYVNDRAEANQDQKERELLMESLAGELSQDIKTYDEYQIPQNRKHQENLTKLIEALTQKDAKKIKDLLPVVFQVENYAPTTSTYASIKASGKFKLIHQFALRKRITDFYEGLAIESIRRNEFQIEFFKTELLPWLIHNMDLYQMSLLSESDNMILRNKLIIYESLIAQKVESYEMIVEESKALQEVIQLTADTN